MSWKGSKKRHGASKKGIKNSGFLSVAPSPGLQVPVSGFGKPSGRMQYHQKPTNVHKSKCNVNGREIPFKAEQLNGSAWRVRFYSPQGALVGHRVLLAYGIKDLEKKIVDELSRKR